MGAHKVEIDYRCYDDCRLSGCPGHTMTATYRRSVDIMHLVWGDPKEQAYFDINELTAFMKLIAAIKPGVVALNHINLDMSTDGVRNL